jgi:inorganic phosphate transporter, PiT family
MEMELFLIFLALAFAFINGFHDSANSTATVIFTRALSPRNAVISAAFFNFIAFLFFGVYIAETIDRGIVNISVIDNDILLAAILSGIIWNILTWYFGFPSSSSHAIIGGLIGAALLKAGAGSLVIGGILKTAAFIILSPLIGFLIGVAFAVILYQVFKNSDLEKVDNIFNRGQIVSSALYSLGHGGNDAQKTIGILSLILVSNGMDSGNFHVAFRVIVSAYAALAIGTLSGGWRIVRTLGERLTKLKPADGFCVETGAAITLFISAFFGIPVSTTQTITGSIAGVGIIRRISAVHWGVTERVIYTWLLTIPFTAAISALIYFIKIHLK